MKPHEGYRMVRASMTQTPDPDFKVTQYFSNTLQDTAILTIEH